VGKESEGWLAESAKGWQCRAMLRTGFSLLVWAAAAMVSPVPEDALEAMRAAQVVVLGEVHDNPLHHRRQAQAVASLAPRALVFEMLTADQAARVSNDVRSDARALEHALDWTNSGWPDFALYYPIFAAAPGARLYGALLPRGVAHGALSGGVADSFGPGAERYGLTEPLAPDQQAAREALQFAAHCDALPEDMLAGMVELQRLRDAMLARAVVRALEETGGPVAVITGNGHARRDWGLPTGLARVVPDVTIYVLGQGEAGAEPDGGFDLVLDAPAVDRPDPCEAFR
jgi:uncharacterized iron-regulated protein